MNNKRKRKKKIKKKSAQRDFTKKKINKIKIYNLETTLNKFRI
jgi:hypothetical protein